MVNKSAVNFFFLTTKVAKKNSEVVAVQDRIITWHTKNKHRSITVLEEISLDLHYHIGRLACLKPRVSIFIKKVIRANTEISVEVGLFVTLLIHLVLFIQIQRNR